MPETVPKQLYERQKEVIAELRLAVTDLLALAVPDGGFGDVRVQALKALENARKLP